MRVNNKAAASILAAAMVCCLPFIHQKEAVKLEAYEDVVGVWTICSGVTIGTKPGMKKTEAECDELTRNTLANFMGQVADLLNPPFTPELLAAHTSFAYNIGMGAYKRSKTLRYNNAGNQAGGCNAMLNWYQAGGKDCRIRSNNCYGVITRRNDEVKLCLSGVKK